MLFEKSLAQRSALVATLLGASLLAACGGTSPEGTKGSAAGGKPELAPRPVTLARAQLADMARTVVVTGTLAADERVTISAKVPGRLASIAVDLGSPVTEGQAIAQIETTDYRLRVDQAESAVAQARALLGLPPDGDDQGLDLESTSLVREARATLDDTRARLERAKTLAEGKLIAQAELDTMQSETIRAESGLESAREQMRGRHAMLRQRRSELASARQQLIDSTLRASIGGVVEARHTSAGELLIAGAPVATIVRTNPLRLRVEVPEREASSVQLAQEVRVTLAGERETYSGKVARMSPSISEQSRTLAVEAEIPNPGTLRPGSFARAEIVMADASQVLVVPSSAIVTFAGIEKVITVVDGKAAEKRITTGRRTTQQTEVLTGLQAGDAVVVAPGNLQEGQPVATNEAR